MSAAASSGLSTKSAVDESSAIWSAATPSKAGEEKLSASLNCSVSLYVPMGRPVSHWDATITSPFASASIRSTSARVTVLTSPVVEPAPVPFVSFTWKLR